MDAEILQALKEIRGVLIVLVLMLGTAFVIWVGSAISNVVANFKKAWADDFINRAQKYFESADLNKLVTHCEDKLSRYPNHANAIWWLARAHMQAGRNTEAEHLFETLRDLKPDWEEFHIQPYLNKLETQNVRSNKTMESDA